MQQLVQQLLQQINQAIYGKTTETKLALACLLAQGHLLIEDLPGMGKTTLAHALANSLNLSFQRIQFTSDLLPADVVGLSMYLADQQQFSLHKGPIFSQVLLADEINRASPKTQSALLEAMEERQVSIDGTSYSLPEPFFVIATQNPTYHAGTYPLPESQLDRFMMRLTLGFPDQQAEKQILLATNKIPSATLADKPASIINLQQFIAMQQAVNNIYCSDSILNYIIALCQISREPEFAGNPLSPRAGKALLACAKAWAFIEQREQILPEDVQAVFSEVCQHRLSGQSAHFHQVEQNLAMQLLQQVDPTCC